MEHELNGLRTLIKIGDFGAKRLIGVLFFAATCTLLTSCGSKASDSYSPPYSSVTDNATEVAPLTDSHDLSFFSSFDIPGLSTDNGYYYIQDIGNSSGNALLRYIDYATKNDMPVCSRPNCYHVDDSCTAWLKYTGNSCTLASCGNKLILIFSGASESYYDLFGESALPHIDIMNQDASQRKTLCSFAANIKFGDTFAADDSYLYFYQVKMESNSTTYNLIKLDCETGVSEALPISLEGKPSPTMIEGAYKDTLYLKSISDNNSNELGGESQTHNLYSYVIPTGKCTLLKSWQKENSSGAIIGNHFFFQNHSTLDCFSLDSWEPVNISSEILDIDGFSFHPLAVLDGNLIASQIVPNEATGNNEYRKYAISLSDGSKQRLTLQAKSLGENVILPFVSDCGNGTVLVCPRMHQISISLPLTADFSVNTTAEQPEFALLSYHDYINNIASYDYIKIID